MQIESNNAQLEVGSVVFVESRRRLLPFSTRRRGQFPQQLTD